MENSLRSRYPEPWGFAKNPNTYVSYLIACSILLGGVSRFAIGSDLGAPKAPPFPILCSVLLSQRGHLNTPQNRNAIFGNLPALAPLGQIDDAARSRLLKAAYALISSENSSDEWNVNDWISSRQGLFLIWLLEAEEYEIAAAAGDRLRNSLESKRLISRQWLEQFATTAYYSGNANLVQTTLIGSPDKWEHQTALGLLTNPPNRLTPITTIEVTPEILGETGHIETVLKLGLLFKDLAEGNFPADQIEVTAKIRLKAMNAAIKWLGAAAQRDGNNQAIEALIGLAKFLLSDSGPNQFVSELTDNDASAEKQTRDVPTPAAVQSWGARAALSALASASRLVQRYTRHCDWGVGEPEDIKSLVLFDARARALAQEIIQHGVWCENLSIGTKELPLFPHLDSAIVLWNLGTGSENIIASLPEKEKARVTRDAQGYQRLYLGKTEKISATEIRLLPRTIQELTFAYEALAYAFGVNAPEDWTLSHLHLSRRARQIVEDRPEKLTPSPTPEDLRRWDENSKYRFLFHALSEAGDHEELVRVGDSIMSAWSETPPSERTHRRAQFGRLVPNPALALDFYLEAYRIRRTGRNSSQ